MALDRKPSKSMLIKALQDEFERWDRVLTRLSEEQITARGLPASLSIKDVVAHLWSWQQLSIERLEAAIDNRNPDYHLGPEGLDPDNEQNLEAINGWIHETNLNRPWEEVYGKWRSGFLTFLERAQAIPEETMMQPARYRWLKDAPLSAVLEGSWAHHHEEHYVPLVDWLTAKGWGAGDR